jgi:ABC-type polysaccharide/polyol phosphate export permease
MLARKDFQTRYKRASLGVLWAVAVPVLQGAIMAVVFSRVVQLDTSRGFAGFVLGGVLAFTYFSATTAAAVTAIVDGASLTDKVWFPRLLLALVPGAANLVGLVITMLVLVATLPVLDVALEPRLLLLVPAVALLVAFTNAFALVVSALHVYFRDTKFLVQAALMVWLYVTPILYPKHLLGGLSRWVDLNPLTGVVAVFHLATVGGEHDWARPVVISVVATLALAVAGFEAQRRHDRLFVDQL